nr:MAG TPA: hypothetical protein [Caudoviricetes sp.]
MKVGYSYWGFLGDMKFGDDGMLASTPDGNAFYSWSIISELQKRGHDVYQMMPDRDFNGSTILGNDILFQSWAKDKRKSAYENMVKTFNTKDVSKLDELSIFAGWDEKHCDDIDVVLHEWRMEIPGRNTEDARSSNNWQPDLFFQNCLIDYCIKHSIKMVIFDLDYKLTEKHVKELIDRGLDFNVFELGNKWLGKSWAKKVYIPFDFKSIYEFKPRCFVSNKLVYVGNRYERDWCIDKYIPTDLDGVAVYGNWDEGGRDSKTRWPKIDFRHRLQTCEMHDVYSNSASTILLAKHDYCEFEFMTARIIEALFYCSVPFFIEEYGDKLIEKFAGGAAKFLTVRSVNDVKKKSSKLFADYTMRCTIINSMRERVKKFMDVRFFVDELLSC